MNRPPLLRPLRHLLQGRLQLAGSRPAPLSIHEPRRRLQTDAAITGDGDAPDLTTTASSRETFRSGTHANNDTTTPRGEPATKPTIESVTKPSTSRNPRLPRSLQTYYLKPLRREAPYGVPSCDLQLRSFSPRNLEFFCDFALRAAYYLGLPAFGPVPLPRLIERWTVPRSVFIFKKSQENFERITMRRLIQIRDGHPETVQIWLAFLQKHAYYGLAMKASLWEFSKLGVAKNMDDAAKEANLYKAKEWEHLIESRAGRRRPVEETVRRLTTERVRLAGGR